MTDNPFTSFDLTTRVDWSLHAERALVFRDLYEGSKTSYGLTSHQLSVLLREAYGAQLEEQARRRLSSKTGGARQNADLPESVLNKIHRRVAASDWYTASAMRYLRGRCEVALFGPTDESLAKCKAKEEQGNSPAMARKFLVPRQRFLITRLVEEFDTTPTDPSDRAFAELLSNAYNGEPGLHDPLSLGDLAHYLHPLWARSREKRGMTRARVSQLIQEVRVAFPDLLFIRPLRTRRIEEVQYEPDFPKLNGGFSRTTLYSWRRDKAARDLLARGEISPEHLAIYEKRKKAGRSSLSANELVLYNEFMKRQKKAAVEMGLERPTKRSLVDPEWLAKQWFLEGLYDKEIASKLGISEAYVIKIRVANGVRGRRAKVNEQKMIRELTRSGFTPGGIEEATRLARDEAEAANQTQFLSWLERQS